MNNSSSISTSTSLPNTTFPTLGSVSEEDTAAILGSALSFSSLNTSQNSILDIAAAQSPNSYFTQNPTYSSLSSLSAQLAASSLNSMSPNPPDDIFPAFGTLAISITPPASNSLRTINLSATPKAAQIVATQQRLLPVSSTTDCLVTPLSASSSPADTRRRTLSLASPSSGSQTPQAWKPRWKVQLEQQRAATTMQDTPAPLFSAVISSDPTTPRPTAMKPKGKEQSEQQQTQGASSLSLALTSRGSVFAPIKTALMRYSKEALPLHCFAKIPKIKFTQAHIEAVDYYIKNYPGILLQEDENGRLAIEVALDIGNESFIDLILETSFLHDLLVQTKNVQILEEDQLNEAIDQVTETQEDYVALALKKAMEHEEINKLVFTAMEEGLMDTHEVSEYVNKKLHTKTPIKKPHDIEALAKASLEKKKSLRVTKEQHKKLPQARFSTLFAAALFAGSLKVVKEMQKFSDKMLTLDTGVTPFEFLKSLDTFTPAHLEIVAYYLKQFPLYGFSF